MIHNTYHGRHIETDNQVIFLITEGLANYFLFPRFNASGPGTLKGVIDNDTTTRYNIFPQWVRDKKRKTRRAVYDAETEIEVAQYYTVLKYRPPRPHKDLKSQD